MSERPACVIFGASGDLTRRKLVPALYHLARDGHFPNGLATFGIGRRPKTDESLRQELLETASKVSRTKLIERETWEGLMEGLHYIQGDFHEAATVQLLREQLKSFKTRLYYFAVGPDDVVGIVKNLSEAGLLKHDPENGIRAHVIIEKPFGDDLQSARKLNESLFAYLGETQVFRIDHYLGKETVQNLAVLRFENAIFEALWNRNFVSHVEITVAEEIGIEGRGKFYESVGITRDIVQNHVLQLLTLVAMEPPAALEANALRDEKVKVLTALRPLVDDAILRDVVRAQYTQHATDAAVPGYRQEPEVSTESAVETYVAMRVFVDNARWSGVPFFLRAGKRLSKRLAEIVVHFKDPVQSLFASKEGRSPNSLAIRLQPDEGITLHFDTKVPGAPLRIQGADLDWSYGRDFGTSGPEAYERLLLDALRGDATLFTRHDEVEAQWRFIDPIVQAYAAGNPPLSFYQAGTRGPTEAERLLLEHGQAWRTLA
jgi:glucose-6-phosphate 1-dehydrogenase